VVANAQAALGIADGIAAQVWRYADTAGPAPESLADVPSSTSASKALAKDLRSHGFRFTGPVTVYATMQACGVVNDHLAGCVSR
jgi:DNA-3-methyladenine glycosylase I